MAAWDALDGSAEVMETQCLDEHVGKERWQACAAESAREGARVQRKGRERAGEPRRVKESGRASGGQGKKWRGRERWGRRFELGRKRKVPGAGRVGPAPGSGRLCGTCAASLAASTAAPAPPVSYRRPLLSPPLTLD